MTEGFRETPDLVEAAWRALAWMERLAEDGVILYGQLEIANALASALASEETGGAGEEETT